MGDRYILVRTEKSLKLWETKNERNLEKKEKREDRDGRDGRKFVILMSWMDGLDDDRARIHGEITRGKKKGELLTYGTWG